MDGVAVHGDVWRVTPVAQPRHRLAPRHVHLLYHVTHRPVLGHVRRSSVACRRTEYRVLCTTLTLAGA